MPGVVFAGGIAASWSDAGGDVGVSVMSCMRTDGAGEGPVFTEFEWSGDCMWPLRLHERGWVVTSRHLPSTECLDGCATYHGVCEGCMGGEGVSSER